MPELQDPLSTIPFICHVAGIPHRKPSALPAVGDTVILEPEPTNIYDPNAIKVLWNTIHLGYIPKEFTFRVRDLDLKELKVAEVEPKRKWKEVVLSR